MASVAPLPPACLLLGGPIYSIDGVRFEWSDRFGPAVVGERGEILANQPGERSRFWTAIALWVEQGKRVADDGSCVYVTPPTPVYVQLVGRHYAEVPDGADPESVRQSWLRKAGLS